MESCKDLGELKTVFVSLPAEAKKELEGIKNELKSKFELDIETLAGIMDGEIVDDNTK